MKKLKDAVRYLIAIGFAIMLLTNITNAQKKLTKTSGYAPVNGIKMYYETYGKGNIPLVLIHGGGSTIQSNFGRILPLLEDYGKIIAVELQAHGRTQDRGTQESFAQDAADVAGLLKYLKIDKANFIGFSNGGTTTLQIAITYPQMVNKIITLSASYQREGMVPGFFEGLRGMTINQMPQVLKDEFLKVTPDQHKLQIMFEQDKNRMIGFKDISDDDIKSIKAPAFIISSDQDVILPEHTLKIARLIPHARFAIMPGEHGAFFGDNYSYKKGSHLYQAAAIMFKEFLKDQSSPQKAKVI